MQGSHDEARRVLVATDDVPAPGVRETLVEPLRRDGYAVTVETDLAAVVERLRRDHVDLLLIALGAPSAGLGLCRTIRSDPRAAFLPVLLHLSDPADVLASLDASADDEVVAPVEQAELLGRVSRVLRRTRQLRAASPLTGLPGTHLVERELASRIAAGRPVALVHADLSRFKSYNDRYGLLRGDAVILATCEVLQRAIERHDPAQGFLAHAGGDDFMLLCAPGALAPLCETAIRLFDGIIGDFYAPADLRAGGVEVPDRRGRVRRFPVVSLALGAASSERGEADHRRLVEIAGEMKLYARREVRSSWALDRREDEAQ